MQDRTVVFITVALFLGIAALTLHLLAICSPHWKETERKNNLEPKMGRVSYGLWQRCETSNVTILKQGMSLGLRPNVQTCQPNWYIRYSPSAFQSCFPFRRDCAVKLESDIAPGCSCRYLPSTRGLQWLTILASGFLVLGLILLYLRTISSPENASAGFLLTQGPFICFLLTLFLMVTGLILLGSYFRREIYEDYSFPLNATAGNKLGIVTSDLQSLKNYAKLEGSSLDPADLLVAEQELRDKIDTHFHTVIGRATIYEIIATALVIVVTALTFWLAVASRSDEV